MLLYAWFWWENLKEKSLGTPNSRCEGNIKMGLQYIGWKSVHRINLPQNDET